MRPLRVRLKNQYAPRMKPASFEYERPAHLDEACALLAAGDDVRRKLRVLMDRGARPEIREAARRALARVEEAEDAARGLELDRR